MRFVVIIIAVAVGVCLAARVRDVKSHLPRHLRDRVSPAPPSWRQSWAMADSTSLYGCNYTGLLDPTFIAQFAQVTIDWSNGKQDFWAQGHPMDGESLLVRQARAIKEARPDAIVMVYRNSVKALSWFKHVRVKLIDPAYSGFFLSFKKAKSSYSVPMCDTAWDPPLCTPLYHDQCQSPQYRSKFPDAGPLLQNGSCLEPCDSGGVPTGEYLWDLRNASARAYMLEDILGPTALGNADITGLYIDDYWVNAQQPISPDGDQPSWGYCTYSPTGGPSEIQLGCIDDMGLTQGDVNDLTAGWTASMASISQAMDDAGAMNYFNFQFGATPGPTDIAVTLRELCAQGNSSRTWSGAWQFAFTVRPVCCPPIKNNTLLQFEEDLAYFLIVRGPWAWLGYGWEFCQATYEMPPALFTDYGDPLGTCLETSAGVFTRRFAHATATFNATSYKGWVTMT